MSSKYGAQNLKYHKVKPLNDLIWSKYIMIFILFNLLIQCNFNNSVLYTYL